VVDTCDRLSYVFYGCPSTTPLRERYGGAQLPIQPAALDLVEISTEFLFPASEWGPGRLLSGLGEGPGRDSLIREWKYIGGFQLYVAEPPDPRHERPAWRFSRRLLAVAEIGTPDPSEEIKVPPGAVSAYRHVRRHTHITRRVLAGAVGRTCRYPSQLLHGTVKDTLELQRVLFQRRVRVASTYGVLRNRSQRLMAAKLAALRGELPS
jgi:hypothetical protein